MLVSSTGCNSTGGNSQSAPTIIGQSENHSSLSSFEQLTAKQKSELNFANGRGMEAAGNFEGAVKAYKDCLASDPNHSQACARIAVCMDKAGKMEESSEWYDKALKLSPGNPDLYCDRGYSFYLQQKFQEAEMSLRQCLAIKRDHQRAYNNLGLVLAHTGRADEAVSSFHNGGSSPALAHQNVAVAMLEQGDFAMAEKQYRLALASDPNLDTAQQGLSELKHLAATSARRQAVYADAGSKPIISPEVAPENTPPPLLAAPAKIPAPITTPTATQPPVNQPVAYVAPAAQTVEATPAVHTESKVTTQPKPTAIAAAPSARRLQFSAGALRRDRYLEEQSEGTIQVTDQN